jgi:hypothetical protein
VFLPPAVLSHFISRAHVWCAWNKLWEFPYWFLEVAVCPTVFNSSLTRKLQLHVIYSFYVLLFFGHSFEHCRLFSWLSKFAMMGKTFFSVLFRTVTCWKVANLLNCEGGKILKVAIIISCLENIASATKILWGGCGVVIWLSRTSSRTTTNITKLRHWYTSNLKIQIYIVLVVLPEIIVKKVK